MVELSRIVRFCVNPGGGSVAGTNGFGGKPPMRGLGRYYELEILCRGEPDRATGYLVNIKDLDRAAWEHAVPIIAQACRERPETEPAEVLPEIAAALAQALPGLAARVRWRLTPTYSVETGVNERPPAPPRVLLRQRFDFAAAHRLHVPSLTPQENVRTFGKCNNPSGHGHNYVYEPCVAVTLGEGGEPFGLAELERLCEEVLTEAFDHKHLNRDTREFAEAGGANPSVENIARVFFERLAPAVRAASERAELVSMTVWETDRTSCTYPG